MRRFIIYDGIGAALWAAGAIALGAMFHEAVEALLDQLEQLGHLALLLLIVAIALFVLFKWWQRQRFMAQIRMSRISVDELLSLLDSGSATRDSGCAQPGASRGVRLDSGQHQRARHLRASVEARRGSHRLLRLPERRLGGGRGEEASGAGLQAGPAVGRWHRGVAGERAAGGPPRDRRGYCCVSLPTVMRVFVGGSVEFGDGHEAVAVGVELGKGFRQPAIEAGFGAADAIVAVAIQRGERVGRRDLFCVLSVSPLANAPAEASRHALPAIASQYEFLHSTVVSQCHLRVLQMHGAPECSRRMLHGKTSSIVP